MNAESAYLYRERKAEVEALGEQAYKRRVLTHLKLKTVLKVIPGAGHPRHVRRLWQQLSAATEHARYCHLAR
jgi:hypothetical protein